MNIHLFFDRIRQSVFNGTMSEPQVDGVNAILESCARNGVTDIDHVSHVLAHVKRETGGYMLGIKETVMSHHRDKTPPDGVVIARLDAAFKARKLKGVRAPYWRDGAFGRGPIQITHWDNYIKFGKRLGVPLRQKPELALDRNIGADIAVVGMKEGLFRDKKLSDYRFPKALDAAPDSNPRRIVNGKDGSDAEVAESHLAFAAALRAAGYDKVAVKNTPITPKSRTAQGTVAAGSGGALIVAEAMTDVSDKLQQADTYISAGTWFKMVIGVVIVGGSLYALYARWQDGGGRFPWQRGDK